ncbi:integrase, catalytic region, zinc finger, CCHC-type containing protein [Tanacetum coccineum]
MWNSIQNGPYVRPMIPDPDGAVNINGTVKQILEPLSKMTEGNKKQYITDVKVMNYLLQAIPNDIYNSLDASKKAAKNHDSLALIAHSNASSSQSHANSSYSPQPYYVTHPSSVVDYEGKYQGKLQGDSQEDKLTTAMMLLARVITQKFSTPTNNRYGGNGNKNAGRQSMNQVKANVQCYNCNEKGHYARDCQKPRVRDAKYFREQMLLAMKDETGSNLNNEENDFMLNTSYGEETMKELTDAVMLMA